MSNTYRKTPVFGNTTAPSEKQDKRLANRKLRRVNKTALLVGDEFSELREISNVWDFAKDGKQYYPPSRLENYPLDFAKKLFRK